MQIFYSGYVKAIHIRFVLCIGCRSSTMAPSKRWSSTLYFVLDADLQKLYQSDKHLLCTFCWIQIFYNGSVKAMDISEENESNWMMFVKPARNAMERNMLAFQRGHDIMFLTTRDLQPDVELLFWFAPDYCRMFCELGVHSHAMVRMFCELGVHSHVMVKLFCELCVPRASQSCHD